MKKNLIDNIIFFILSFVMLIQSCSQQQIFTSTIRSENTKTVIDRENKSFSVKHNDNDIPCLPSNLSNYDKPFTTSSFKIQNTETEDDIPLTIEQFSILNKSIESIKLTSFIDLSNLKKYSNNIIKLNERIKISNSIDSINRIKEQKLKEETKKRDLFKKIDDFQDSIISKGLEIREEAEVLMGHLYPRVHVFNESDPNKRIEMFELFFDSSDYDFNIFANSDNTYELAKAGAVIGRELYVFDDLVYMYIRGQLDNVDSTKYNVLNLLSKYLTQINKHKKNYFIAYEHISSVIKSIEKQINKDVNLVISNQKALLDYLNDLEFRNVQIDKEIKEYDIVLNNIEKELFNISSGLNIDIALNNTSNFNIQAQKTSFSIKNSANCRYSAFDGAEVVCSQDQIITQKDSGLDTVSAGFEEAANNQLSAALGSFVASTKLISELKPKINNIKEEIKVLEERKKVATKIEKAEIESKINKLDIEKKDLDVKLKQAERAKKESNNQVNKATDRLNNIKKQKESKNSKVDKVNKAKDKLDGIIQNKKNVCSNKTCSNKTKTVKLVDSIKNAPDWHPQSGWNQPKGWEAHHIVEELQNSKGAKDARDLLESLGIDYKVDPNNLIHLPKSKNKSPFPEVVPGWEDAVKHGRMPDTYSDAVNDRLQDAFKKLGDPKTNVQKELRDIMNDLKIGNKFWK